MNAKSESVGEMCVLDGRRYPWQVRRVRELLADHSLSEGDLEDLLKIIDARIAKVRNAPSIHAAPEAGS